MASDDIADLALFLYQGFRIAHERISSESLNFIAGIKRSRLDGIRFESTAEDFASCSPLHLPRSCGSSSGGLGPDQNDQCRLYH